MKNHEQPDEFSHLEESTTESHRTLINREGEGRLFARVRSTPTSPVEPLRMNAVDTAGHSGGGRRRGLTGLQKAENNLRTARLLTFASFAALGWAAYVRYTTILIFAGGPQNILIGTIIAATILTLYTLWKKKQVEKLRSK